VRELTDEAGANLRLIAPVQDDSTREIPRAVETEITKR
jgi:hypothetical protein